MSMQMIGRRSISVPGCDQNFPATAGYRGQLCPFDPPPSTTDTPPRLNSAPAGDKRGPAPVDNGPMALRMQAQGSALFEFVAFCLCLSATAAAATPFRSFSDLLSIAVPFLCSPRFPRSAPILAGPFCKLQSPICRPFVSMLFFSLLNPSPRPNPEAPGKR